jgi:predicted neuraminidase
VQPAQEPNREKPEGPSRQPGSSIVELPNGDLLACWFAGSGERWADDVAIMGSRLIAGREAWSAPFVMADVPEFPDINPTLFIDPRGTLWLVWYTVMANQWDTSLLKYRTSEDYMMREGPPAWKWQDVIHVKPGDRAEGGILTGDRFVRSVERQSRDYTQYLVSIGALSPGGDGRGSLAAWEAARERTLAKARGEDMMRPGFTLRDGQRVATEPIGYAYFRRMGWQTQNKPTILDGRRIILPLYSDGFGFSLMAITDDWGQTWSFSGPLVGAGNIQPAIARKRNGTLVAYMRDNGPPPKRLHVSESTDRGMTWSPVRYSNIPNPGSGADIVVLRNGNWVLIYNDLESGRHSLAVSLSTDEGATWAYTRHLERDDRDPEIATRGHYPAIVQGADGSLHITYSLFHLDRRAQPHKTIKYVRLNEAWIRHGDNR